jgi:hypothetical protein
LGKSGTVDGNSAFGVDTACARYHH